MENKKISFGMEEIRARYGCGQSTAYRIIREVKSLFPHGGKLGAGKVLPAELEYWENYIEPKAQTRAGEKDTSMDASCEQGARRKTVCV